MKISASLYSSKHVTLLDAARELEPYYIDFWHIDSREDFKVFEDIDKLSQFSKVPVDLHIIAKQPSVFFKDLERKLIRRVSFQIENIEEEIHFPSAVDKEWGLAITIGHPNIEEVIATYKNHVSFILLMMTTPGVSGGHFDKAYFQKIGKLIRQFPAIQWCIDGGVNHEISYILRLIGVQNIVIGSYLLNHENMAQAILQLRSNYVKSEYQVKDFCIANEDLPLVKSKTSVVDLLTIIQNYQLGIAFYVDDSNRLLGIISNADIRKVLIEGNFNYNMSVHHFVNSNPKYILEDTSTAEMIEYIQSVAFPILVLPVLNTEHILKGAVSFHKLLKEE